jgi:hypothetical protein
MEVFIIGIIHKISKNMKHKEIDNIIREQTEMFFKEENFKFSKKDMGYIKNIEHAHVNYGYSYLEYHPEYYYRISMQVTLKETEEIYCRMDGSECLGITYVFPLSFFLGTLNYFNYNQEFLITYEKDINHFSMALIENYKKYYKDFIPYIVQPQNMLDFLLNEISSGKEFVIKEEMVLIRTLILMKQLNYPNLKEKANEFKEYLKEFDADLKEIYFAQMDRVITENY